MQSKLLLSMALVFALAVSHAEARGKGGHKGGGFGGGHHRMLKELDLTKEQRETALPLVLKSQLSPSPAQNQPRKIQSDTGENEGCAQSHV